MIKMYAHVNAKGFGDESKMDDVKSGLLVTHVASILHCHGHSLLRGYYSVDTCKTLKTPFQLL